MLRKCFKNVSLYFAEKYLQNILISLWIAIRFANGGLKGNVSKIEIKINGFQYF